MSRIYLYSVLLGNGNGSIVIQSVINYLFFDCNLFLIQLFILLQLHFSNIF